MNRTCVASTLILTVGLLMPTAQAAEPQIVSPNAFKVPYLGLDGAFVLAGDETSTEDPRNPGRIVFDKMEFFSFYRDIEGQEPIAEGCHYLYRGAAGDPFYYPERFLGSIWDMFELRNTDKEECLPFKYVITRSPHGDPPHLHLRHGGDDSTFAQLLEISTLEEDPKSFNPWWSTYCDASAKPEDCHD